MKTQKPFPFLPLLGGTLCLLLVNLPLAMAEESVPLLDDLDKIYETIQGETLTPSQEENAATLSFDRDEDTSYAPTEIRALLVPKRDSTLASQLNAQIAKINVEEGDSFTEGDILLEYDCALYEGELDKSKAEYDAAEKTLNTNIELAKYDSVSKLDLELARSHFEKAKAQKKIIETTVTYCTLNAPYTGRVVDLYIKPFQTVGVGQEMISILDDSRLQLQVIVPSRWLSWLQEGSKFSVKIDENQKIYPAIVTKMGARIDAVSQSIKITGEIDGRFPELISGMSGRAIFDAPTPTP